VDFKDYYEILGVSPSASKKDIQQTYRQLARKYHPDVNPGNKETEEKFKAINEAYQVLSNEEQRKKFDALRSQYLQWKQSGGRQQDFDWQSWSNRAGGASQPGGVHVEYADAEDFEDLFGSESPYSDFFTNLFGQARKGGKGSRRTTSTGPRRGRDVEYDIDMTLEEAYRGAERLLEIDGRRVTVRIPPGVDTGSRVRLSGQGEPGLNGGQAGDLYLIVRILPNKTFERAGDDLHMDVPVDIFTAIAGGEVHVPALEKQLILTIPPRTNANQSFRLRGKGMPHLGSPEKHGDLYARVRLVLPEGLTDQEIENVRALASARKKDSGDGKR
jgi:curved DNA-binding protein